MRSIWARFSVNMALLPSPDPDTRFMVSFLGPARLSHQSSQQLVSKLFSVNTSILSNIAVVVVRNIFPSSLVIVTMLILYIMAISLPLTWNLKTTQDHFLTTKPVTITARQDGQDFTLLLAAAGTPSCSC